MRRASDAGRRPYVLRGLPCGPIAGSEPQRGATEHGSSRSSRRVAASAALPARHAPSAVPSGFAAPSAAIPAPTSRRPGAPPRSLSIAAVGGPVLGVAAQPSVARAAPIRVAPLEAKGRLVPRGSSLVGWGATAPPRDHRTGSGCRRRSSQALGVDCRVFCYGLGRLGLRTDQRGGPSPGTLIAPSAESALSVSPSGRPGATCREWWRS